LCREEENLHQHQAAAAKGAALSYPPLSDPELLDSSFSVLPIAADPRPASEAAAAQIRRRHRRSQQDAQRRGLLRPPIHQLPCIVFDSSWASVVSALQSSSEFVDALDGALATCDFRVRPLDKKKERYVPAVILFYLLDSLLPSRRIGINVS
jgi:hypothetical protein